MTSYEVAYCTRESVQRALQLADMPRLNSVIDDAILAGARQLEGLLHRKFYPETKTLTFPQPDGDSLWLYENELAAAPTEIVSGDQTMTVDVDVFLRPENGPPYRWLEASYSGDVFWQAVGTPQDAIAITSDAWNYPVTTRSAGTITTGVNIGAGLIALSDSSAAGVGSLILIDSERMIVTEKTMTSTGATLAADIAAQKNVNMLSVSNGALINPGEMLLIDSERVQVQYVTGNTLTVDRAVNASTLAAHSSGAILYAPRAATVTRAALGTVAAAHSSGAAITLLLAPSLVRGANRALAINTVEQELGAYTRAVGAGDNARDSAGRGVQPLLDDAYTAYGRKARSRAV
jgi:hypothetical protein